MHCKLHMCTHFVLVYQRTNPLCLQLYLKVSKSQKQILNFSFEPKTNENIFVLLASKIGQIKKNICYIELD